MSRVVPAATLALASRLRRLQFKKDQLDAMARRESVDDYGGCASQASALPCQNLPACWRHSLFAPCRPVCGCSAGTHVNC